MKTTSQFIQSVQAAANTPRQNIDAADVSRVIATTFRQLSQLNAVQQHQLLARLFELAARKKK